MAIVLPSFPGWNPLSVTNREFFAKSSITVADIPAMQPARPFFSASPPPLWEINPTSSAAAVPTTSELTSSPKVSEVSMQKMKPSGRLSPLAIPSSPMSPDPQLSASSFSSASTPVKYLSVVSGKLRAGLPEELDPYYTIECYDRLTNKRVVPMHASMIGCTASTTDTEPNGSAHEVPMITSSASSLLSSSTARATVGVRTLKKPQPDNSPKAPIQSITLTHKYQENKHSRQQKKHSDTSSPSGSRSHSNSPSNGNSTCDVSVVGIPSSAESVSATTEVNIPAEISPSLATHSMLNTAITAAAGLPAIPQPFPLPIMFHPTFTPTTPGTQLPFVYPSLTPLGVSSPLSALQQFPMLQQSHPNPYMMVDFSTFVWPPSSKVAGTGFNFMMPNSSVLQTPPSSALQENFPTRKRCTPPPVVKESSQVASTIPEPSPPKKTRPDFVLTNSSSHLPHIPTLSSATLSPISAASITRHNNIPIVSQEMDTSHKLVTDDAGSSSESEMKDNDDSDSEDDVVTCPQERAPIEVPDGRGIIQLWQFLLDMLLTPDKSFMIHWTGNEYEFTILQPDDIAAMWGERKGKPRMNYDKLSRGLRYYYSKGIMDKVPGKKLTFKFTCNVEDYVRTRSRNSNAVQTLRAIIRNNKLNHSSSSDLQYNTLNIH